MNKKSILLISLICALVGALIYALHKDWIIIRLPNSDITQSVDDQIATPGIKKKIILYFWHHDKWNHETTHIIATDNKAETISHIITSWLALLDEAEITYKKISLQSVLLSPSRLDAYISFEHSLLGTQATTHEKWMLIEGLLKTLRENGIKLQGIRFLVQHQAMSDPHLDFSNAWPITGFLEQI